MRRETHDRLARCETPVTMALTLAMLLLVIWTQGTRWPMWAFLFTSGSLALIWALAARRWLHPKHWFLAAIGTAMERPGS
jgi:tetrahydromethanopterin S-methyltransferase subunit C